MKVGRAIVLRINHKDNIANMLAIRLEDHTNTVTTLVKKLFNLEDEFLKTCLLEASRQHDKYKPNRFGLYNGEVGFRRHPYLLSFTDFEGLSNKVAVGIATGIGREHHFMNIRDMNNFLYTIALVKSYTKAKLSLIRNYVLTGVALLHIADMIAGFIEHNIMNLIALEQLGIKLAEKGMKDSNSLERIEGYLPYVIQFTRNGASVHFYGFNELLSKEVMEGMLTLSLRYGVYHLKCSVGKRGKLIIDNFSFIREYPVSLSITHKRNLIRGVI